MTQYVLDSTRKKNLQIFKLTPHKDFKNKSWGNYRDSNYQIQNTQKGKLEPLTLKDPNFCPDLHNQLISWEWTRLSAGLFNIQLSATDLNVKLTVSALRAAPGMSVCSRAAVVVQHCKTYMQHFHTAFLCLHFYKTVRQLVDIKSFSDRTM